MGMAPDVPLILPLAGGGLYERASVELRLGRTRNAESLLEIRAASDFG